ncbi:SDR family NAD(P)-dependent oxidoreductase [Flavivirga rizhaonensis]|uniref:SDR family NAD(P)-dependent oxidoreductase n=1 Tax=Flavivirga rizhaonensis TaxID=2559571 RepID=A0A4S1E089_9FLAO|nr:SDR family NAD(P)-dependent oxidoreductase [Flavivirga rizhaonensis]TGV03966.1 SDR family NAD(P)-dependent oxidoreductase [Flavivirga rizhaonensis]
MNKTTSDHIDRLLIDSGLFPTPKKTQRPVNSFDFSDDTILITGAAGSIGSELSKQLLTCSYKKLILVDIAESPLYNLIKDLEFENTNKIDFLLLNITEHQSIRHLFETYRPTLIFHAAAYKHVPLMEENAYKAIKLNILGTKLLADLSIKYRVEKFIFISTDKAVNPVSVMGMSKRIAEKYLNYLSNKLNTGFTITRFGNILGSNGSVLPLFKKQIKSNTPLTITDKNVSRYFISKSKACSLILQVATFNNEENNIFTFNMGEPIRITDLAERLVSLCSNINKKIEIKITGLRPGEKLHESIVSNSEILVPINKNILLVESKNNLETKNIDFSELEGVTLNMSNLEVKSILKKYI